MFDLKAPSPVDITAPKPIMKDVDLAAELYLKSARLDYVPAMVNLATLIFKQAKNNRSLSFGKKKGEDGKPAANSLEVFGED
mmetsp:Transcript_17021/g.26285  ORF Transcript_17021/g.26285 Transcript_17021/m.26285 type:complete len:82 (+) Transcript_17021:945-1190(+)